MGVSYFFDTYAFFEIFSENKHYEQFTKNINILTTTLNLMELHYGMLRTFGREIADRYYDELREFCIEMDDEVIKAANELKNQFKERRLSYIDCIGYILAKTRNVPFLTGDKQFEDMDNVEYVK
ncbi:MAG: PIN domain-containing protein [Nanoarchaeota archaeon]